MSRRLFLVVRVDAEERALISQLADRLQRNQSDVVRLLVREALRGLDAQRLPGQAPTSQEEVIREEV
jgi:hypothetical protein